MHVSNVHGRHIRADWREVGDLIDSLASAQDRLWPHDRWPRMRFDTTELVVGALGGHGPIGYAVRDHRPQRSATFVFTGRPRGLSGTHTFVVVPEPDGCVLWHLADGDATGSMRLTWLLFLRPLHDALIEDALTRAQLEVGDPDGQRGPKWSLWVRVLRRAQSAPIIRRRVVRRTEQAMQRPAVPSPAGATVVPTRGRELPKSAAVRR